MKKILIILVFVVLLAGGIFVFVWREKIVSGIVVDCTTNEPIAGAEVSAHQHITFAIGHEGFVYRTTSDDTGAFKLSYKVGDAAQMTVRKDGYIAAQQFEYPREDIVVRMLQGNAPTEVTYNCKLSSECLETTIESGVQVTRNVCVD